MAGTDDVKPETEKTENPTEGANSGAGTAGGEHLNIKVTDGNNEVFFRIRRSTQLKKLMDTFCDRQGKSRGAVRFLFDGQRVSDTDTPESLDMGENDTIEVYQEQVGGSAKY
ncbi:ubiquitin-related domain-containing protein [Lipomyces japonicus]|uniref:ubiquitin-related domain-containing protein n=1 Tax=Lipomyces japonicus TaxID=56871 RepID=UPI0034CE8B53